MWEITGGFGDVNRDALGAVLTTDQGSRGNSRSPDKGWLIIQKKIDQKRKS